MNRCKSHSGFTLAELLIALGILGVIATFTIPKVLTSTTSSQNSAIAKEAASMISGAFSAYALENSVASGTTAGIVTNYLNYVSLATTGSLITGGATCATNPCLKLHNGGALQYATANTFNGSTLTHSVVYNLDPDGAGTATPCTFVQFYNGRLSTVGAVGTGNMSTNGAPTSFVTDPSYIQNWN